MKRKNFLIVLRLVLAVYLSGCNGGGFVTPSTNMTGNWTMTNTITATNNPLHKIGTTTTSKCNIVDSSGLLTIYDFYIVNEEFVTWNTGYGTINNSTITLNLNGNYINYYGDIVSNTIYFEGTLNDNGLSGSGTYILTISVYGYTWTTWGTTIFIKG